MKKIATISKDEYLSMTLVKRYNYDIAWISSRPHKTVQGVLGLNGFLGVSNAYPFDPAYYRNNETYRDLVIKAIRRDTRFFDPSWVTAATVLMDNLDRVP